MTDISQDETSGVDPQLAADLLSNDRGRVKRAIESISAQRLADHLETDTGTAGLVAAFDLMPTFYRGGLPERAVIRWAVTRRSQGKLERDVELTPDSCTIGEKGAFSAQPAATLTAPASAFVALACGATRGVELMSRGDLRVAGNVQLAMKMERLFDLEPNATSS
ncbi:SCP2 sterol-binding domain-containing protein [Nocardia sp. NPDC050408]|uniref:SCP2 sterol-binding domain-containing protein n=1 Tax=unclassified Nocardia TaxID=2637762 RepID=UPI00343842F5